MRFLWISLYILFAFSACTNTGAKNREKADLHMQIGTSHYEKGNYPYALQELLEAEKLDPNNPLVHNNLGLVYHVRGRYDLAEKHIRRAFQLEPKFTDARNNLARILIDQKKYKEAEQVLAVVLEDLTYAGGDRAWFNLGFLKFQQKLWSEAQRAFEQSLTLNRDNCATNSYLGRTVFEMGKYVEARRLLDQAVTFCQKELFDEPHYYSALAWYRSGDQERARTRFREIIQIYPQGQYRERAQALLDLMEKKR